MEEAGIESGIKALLEAIMKGSDSEAEGITKNSGDNYPKLFYLTGLTIRETGFIE